MSSIYKGKDIDAMRIRSKGYVGRHAACCGAYDSLRKDPSIGRFDEDLAFSTDGNIQHGLYRVACPLCDHARDLQILLERFFHGYCGRERNLAFRLRSGDPVKDLRGRRECDVLVLIPGAIQIFCLPRRVNIGKIVAIDRTLHCKLRSGPESRFIPLKGYAA